MKTIDYIVIFLIAACFAAAITVIVRRKKHGSGCCNSGCSNYKHCNGDSCKHAGQSADCSHCRNRFRGKSSKK